MCAQQLISWKYPAMPIVRTPTRVTLVKLNYKHKINRQFVLHSKAIRIRRRKLMEICRNFIQFRIRFGIFYPKLKCNSFRHVLRMQFFWNCNSLCFMMGKWMNLKPTKKKILLLRKSLSSPFYYGIICVGRQKKKWLS